MTHAPTIAQAPTQSFYEYMVFGVMPPAPQYYTRLLIENQTVRPSLQRLSAMMAMIKTMEAVEAA